MYVDCLYVTSEPCTMCVGALIHARVQRLVYGTVEPKAGAVRSQLRLLEQEFYNHRPSVTSGVLEQPCRDQLNGFFHQRRARIKAQKRAPDEVFLQQEVSIVDAAR